MFTRSWDVEGGGGKVAEPNPPPSILPPSLPPPPTLQAIDLGRIDAQLPTSGEQSEEASSVAKSSFAKGNAKYVTMIILMYSLNSLRERITSVLDLVTVPESASVVVVCAASILPADFLCPASH